jgi:hypothetical protein
MAVVMPRSSTGPLSNCYRSGNCPTFEPPLVRASPLIARDEFNAAMVAFGEPALAAEPLTSGAADQAPAVRTENRAFSRSAASRIRSPVSGACVMVLVAQRSLSRIAICCAS